MIKSNFKKIALVSLIILPVSGLAAPGLYYSCDQSGKNCSIYATTTSDKKVFVENGFTVSDFQTDTSFLYHPNNLVEVAVSCGSPCSTSIFIDLNTGAISDSFFLPIAIDPYHKLIAYPGKNGSPLIIANIFDPTKQIVIERNFSDVATIYSIVSVQFLKNTPAIQLNYEAGKNFVDTTETVSLNYKVLGVGNS